MQEVNDAHGESSTSPRRHGNGVTFFLVMVAVVCFGGSSLQFGYNIAVVNAPELVIQKFFHNKDNWKSIWWPLAVSIFAIGGMIGACIGPHVAKLLGRQKALMLNNVLVIVGGVLLFLTKETHSLAILVIGRIFVGINAGVNTVVAPMYLSEIAPVNLRGSLGTLSQFGIVTGILTANILGLPQLLGNSEGWPYAFGITSIIGVLQLIALPFCPESPRYLLVMKNDEVTAIKNLKRLRNSNDVSEEIEEMKLEASRESATEYVTVLGLLKTSSYRKPLLISIVLQLSQQLSGIGGILYYSTSLFKQIGLNEGSSQAATCGVGALSVFMTAIVVFLVEIKGRRFLMLAGLGSMAILYGVVTIALHFVDKNNDEVAKYVGVVSTLAAVAAFQLGPGAIPWFIVSELFNQAAISAAVSIAGPTNWLGNFVVGLLFPVMKSHMGAYTFIPFLVLLVIFFLFTYFIVPETKGLTIAEINAILTDNENDRKEKTCLLERDLHITTTNPQ